MPSVVLSIVTSSPCLVSELFSMIFASWANDLPVRFSMLASWVATALSRSAMNGSLREQEARSKE